MSDIVINPNAPAPTQGERPALDLGPTAPQPGAPASAAAAMICDGTTDTFMADVIEASQSIPVIVDFWSPRSEACRVLIPVLEKLVKRAGGLVKLVKIEAERNIPLAQQMRVQSVPTVFAFKNGQPVDAFAGMQSEAQVQIFIDHLIGDAKPPIEAAMDQAAEVLAAGDGVQAEAIYTTILSQDSSYLPALSGMIRAISAQGDYDRAFEIINALDLKTRTSAEIEHAVSALELAQQASQVDTSEVAALESKIAADAKDLTARYDLSVVLMAQNRFADAIEQLLEIVRLDRTWNDAAGRKQLIKIFDTLGAADPLTQDARRRLSALLFS